MRHLRTLSVVVVVEIGSAPGLDNSRDRVISPRNTVNQAEIVDVGVEEPKDYKRGFRTNSHQTSRDGIDLARQAPPPLLWWSSREGNVTEDLKRHGRRRKIWWRPRLLST